jgi:transcription-repair coupling factor (superfamily II helicase)
MKIQELLALYGESNGIQRLSKAINKANAKISIKGTIGSVDAIIAACIYNFSYRSQVFIFNDADEAKYFHSDLGNILEGKTVLYFPASYKRSYQLETLENNQVLERAEVK